MVVIDDDEKATKGQFHWKPKSAALELIRKAAVGLHAPEAKSKQTKASQKKRPTCFRDKIQANERDQPQGKQQWARSQGWQAHQRLRPDNVGKNKERILQNRK